MCGQADIDKAVYVIKNDIKCDSFEIVNIEREYKNVKNKISILKEIRSGERRFILFPKYVFRSVDAGYSVIVECGAGAMAGYEDTDYKKSGAKIVDRKTAWSKGGYGVGYMPTFESLTTHSKPFYCKFCVQNCKIDAMPSSVPITASHANSANIWRYVLTLANNIFYNENNSISRRGCLVSNGKIIHSELARHIQYSYYN